MRQKNYRLIAVAWRHLSTCWIVGPKQQFVCLVYYITQSFNSRLCFFHVDHPHVQVSFITVKTNCMLRIAGCTTLTAISDQEYPDSN
jgi:hypothetical protein